MEGKGRVLLVLFLPFALNFLISTAIATYVISTTKAPSEEIGREIFRTIMTYNFYWSIIQVTFGLYAARAMGGSKWLKEQYSREDFSDALRSAGLVLGLVVISTAVIWAFQFLAALSSGGIEAYFKTWKEMVATIPLWSRLYFVLVAPFTAGIFEEILWRGYGISRLEEHMGTRKAVLVQAVAFGLWHGISLHTIATAIIGLIYGYVYASRRRLLVISTAHVLTDIIGFYLAFFT